MAKRNSSPKTKSTSKQKAAASKTTRTSTGSKKSVVTKTSKGKKDSKMAREIGDLARMLSGEMQLREKEELVAQKKEEAKVKRREALREGVKQREIVVEEDDLPAKPVIQNIKLYEWEAPIRVKFFFDMKAFLVVVAASLIFIIFLAILGHYLLMFAIVAVLFLVYVAGTTEPVLVKHKITARGIDTMNKLYEWFMLDQFWFTIKNGQNMLIVTTRLRYPTQLILLLDEKERKSLFVLLQEKILYRDIKKVGFIERATFGEPVKLENV
ncbi:MAG: hypothetical protein Fur003_5790 [Candidatus Dojkabacteria bacterium]